MQSCDHFHNRKTFLTSRYPTLFGDDFFAEFWTDHEIGVFIP